MFENFPDEWRINLEALNSAPMIDITEYAYYNLSACAVLSFDGLHTIFYLHTWPDERKKGFATKVVQKVIRVHERPLFARYRINEIGPKRIFEQNGFKKVFQTEDGLIIVMHNANS